MKTIYTTALAAFFVVFFPHASVAQECENADGFKTCSMPEPYECAHQSSYDDPNHFADTFGGTATFYRQITPTEFLLRVSVYDKNGELLENLVFVHNNSNGSICLVARGTPLGEAL